MCGSVELFLYPLFFFLTRMLLVNSLELAIPHGKVHQTHDHWLLNHLMFNHNSCMVYYFTFNCLTDRCLLFTVYSLLAVSVIHCTFTSGCSCVRLNSLLEGFFFSLLFSRKLNSLCFTVYIQSHSQSHRVSIHFIFNHHVSIHSSPNLCTSFLESPYTFISCVFQMNLS